MARHSDHKNAKRYCLLINMNIIQHIIDTPAILGTLKPDRTGQYLAQFIKCDPKHKKL